MERITANELCHCPYCFKNFNPNMAMFKAMTVYTKQDISHTSENDPKKLYVEMNDEKYDDFWKQFPGSKPNAEQNPYEKHSLLSLVDISGLNSNAPMDARREFPIKVDEGLCKHDMEGFLYEMTDTEGNPTRIRVCPLCHNLLPHEFGKYPVKYIAIVGITSSGKTVYLSQLLSKIDEFMTRANLTVIGTHHEIDQFVREYPIRRNKKLPSGTVANKFTLPMSVNVKDNISGQRYTLVFYDIAGENCVRPEMMSRYGKFVENANGLIMIIDPSQLVDITGQNDGEEDVIKPQQVILSMYESFLSNKNKGGKTDVPIAVAISKSDLLADTGILSESSVILRNVDYIPYDRGFVEEEGRKINYEIRSLIDKGNNMSGKGFMDVLDNDFENKSFFAFSALNCKAEKNEDGEAVILSEPEPIRVEEPLLWSLHKMGLVQKSARKDGTGGSGGNSGGKKRGLFGRR